VAEFLIVKLHETHLPDYASPEPHGIHGVGILRGLGICICAGIQFSRPAGWGAVPFSCIGHGSFGLDYLFGDLSQFAS
jgi:hypothetical protein